jgi:drug/metabolite transporter (DMT)-like permease
MRRRPSTVEVMLLTTIVLWSLNLTVSRYILTHGFQPLAYATVRYGLAVVVFVALTLLLERSLRIRRRDLGLVAGAALLVYSNQIGFVYALERSSASVLGLILGATPIFAALAGVALRTEILPPRFWAGAVLSFVGVALVALGSGSQVSGDVGGVLLGLLTAATWAGYSMLVTPLMGRYTARRISAVVLGAAWVGIALTSVPQVRSQDWSLGWEVWALLVFATLGPLVLTNELWFRSLDRIGPARATLAANLQPFLAAALAVVLLHETLAPIEIAGGFLIGAGILVARRRRVSAPPSE